MANVIDITPFVRLFTSTIISDMQALIKSTDTNVLSKLTALRVQLIACILELLAIDQNSQKLMYRDSALKPFYLMISNQEVGEDPTGVLNEIVNMQEESRIQQLQLQTIVKMFTIEHLIMKILTPNNPEAHTALYAIYYTTGRGGKKELIEKTVDANELYQSLGTGMILFKEGTKIIESLGFNLEQAKNLNAIKEEKTNIKDNPELQQVLSIFGNKALLATLRRELMREYEELKNIKGHKGGERNERYLTLLKLLYTDKYNKDREKFIKSYFVNMGSGGKKNAVAQLGVSGRTLSYNRGHVMEALYRLLNREQSGIQLLGDSIVNATAIESAWSASLGKTPWWAGGDVGYTLVKSMLGTSKQAQLTNLYTVFELANNLLSILDQQIIAREKLDSLIAGQITRDISSIDTSAANADINLWLEEEVQKLLGTLGNSS